MGALLKAYTGRNGISLRLSPSVFGRKSRKAKLKELEARSCGSGKKRQKARRR
jgi:hypothetical protein